MRSQIYNIIILSIKPIHLTKSTSHGIVRSGIRKVKLTFILCFGSNRNAFYLYRATSATFAAALIVYMHSCERGVAILRFYPCPAVYICFRKLKKLFISQVNSFPSVTWIVASFQQVARLLGCRFSTQTFVAQISNQKQPNKKNYNLHKF